MKNLGCGTIGDVAFVTLSAPGSSVNKTRTNVFSPLLGEDQSRVLPLRRSHVQAFAFASADADRHLSGRLKEVSAIHPAEEADRRNPYKKRCGFQISGVCDSSQKMMTRLRCLLVRIDCRYMKWEHCTRRERD